MQRNDKYKKNKYYRELIRRKVELEDQYYDSITYVELLEPIQRGWDISIRYSNAASNKLTDNLNLHLLKYAFNTTYTRKLSNLITLRRENIKVVKVTSLENVVYIEGTNFGLPTYIRYTPKEFELIVPDIFKSFFVIKTYYRLNGKAMRLYSLDLPSYFFEFKVTKHMLTHILEYDNKIQSEFVKLTNKSDYIKAVNTVYGRDTFDDYDWGPTPYSRKTDKQKLKKLRNEKNQLIKLL